MADRLAKLACGLAVAVGLAAVGLGLSVFVEAWQTSRAWVGSAEVLHADLPSEAPIWLDEPADASDTAHRDSSIDDGVPMRAVAPVPTSQPAVGVRVAQATPAASADPSVQAVPTLRPGATGVSVADVSAAPDQSVAPVAPVGESTPDEARASAAPASPSRPAPDEIALAEADFRFLDPPEPGAHARLAVTVQSRADRPTGPLSLVLSTRWLQSFQVFGAIPAVLDDHSGAEGDRLFVFEGLAPGERRTLELHVLASAEEVDAPDVRILLADGAEIAHAHPRTMSPHPRPGPARAIAIPKLGVQAAVVSVPWEPPPFVVGQLQGTAAVSEGNTVLVGHLRGPAGDVFARLDRLRPGDEVIATSRGLEYRFVVSEVAVRPYDDVQETRPTSTPRLTMMTCTGAWSITRQDYSHRLWVVAEPPELAQQTIQANAERAAQAAREAEAAAAARAAHEAELQGPPSAEVAESAAVPPTIASSAAPTAVSPSSPTPVPAGTQPAPEGAGTSSDQPTAGLAELASPVAETTVSRPGIAIDEPAEGVGVPHRLVVRGRRTADAPGGLALWLVVRADLEGSRWYALDRPLDVRPDGTWEASLELGGAPGIRHEIRVGTVDAAAEVALRRHVADHPGQPLDDLPEGFQAGARVTVDRR